MTVMVTALILCQALRSERTTWHLIRSSPHRGGRLVEKSFGAEAAAVATSLLSGCQLTLLLGPALLLWCYLLPEQQAPSLILLGSLLPEVVSLHLGVFCRP